MYARMVFLAARQNCRPGAACTTWLLTAIAARSAAPRALLPVGHVTVMRVGRRSQPSVASEQARLLSLLAEPDDGMAAVMTKRIESFPGR